MRVFAGSEIIPVSSCASAYRASGQVGSVLIQNAVDLKLLPVNHDN